MGENPDLRGQATAMYSLQMTIRLDRPTAPDA
jgi:hypothetical protein